MSAIVSDSVNTMIGRRWTVRQLPIRLARFAVDVWLRHTERRVAMSLRALGHEGILADARSAGLPHS